MKQKFKIRAFVVSIFALSVLFCTTAIAGIDCKVENHTDQDIQLNQPYTKHCIKHMTIPAMVPKKGTFGPGTAIVHADEEGGMFGECGYSDSRLYLQMYINGNHIGDIKLDKGAGKDWRANALTADPSYSISAEDSDFSKKIIIKQ